MSNPLSRQLRVLRAERGLNIMEAAQLIGIGRDTLSELERGRRLPAVTTVARIAEGYGVPVEGLLDLLPEAEAGPLEERLAPRIARLELLELSELLELQRELKEGLSELKVWVPYKGGVKQEVTDFPAYLELTDEMLALMDVLEKKYGKLLS